MKLVIQNMIVSNWPEESINQEREAGKYTLLKIFKGTMRVLSLITIQMNLKARVGLTRQTHVCPVISLVTDEE